MASTTLSSSVLKSKFRGCMIGVLVGDCLGTPFEFEGYKFRYEFIKIIPPAKTRLCNFMIDLINEESTKELHYTDDTAMTISVASSLAEKDEINAKDMAERFVDAYFKDTRGYGANVMTVFHKLKATQFKDIFLPAKEQFDGSGSYGNGAAMRIAPIALFGHNKGEEYITNAVMKCSLITHAHPNGYRGGILQCLAVLDALKLDSSQELDSINFIDNLLEKMEKIETEKTKDHVTSWELAKKRTQHFLSRVGGKEIFNKEKPYCDSLKKMKEFFLQNRDVSSEEIADCLGNGHDVSALKSVPAAIYSFLRGLKPLKVSDVSELKSVSLAESSFLKVVPSENSFEISNPFMRTIFFAISLGGDTDTIAAMAGALAGAYYGEDMIPNVVQKRCQAIDNIISLADKLFDVTYKDK